MTLPVLDRFARVVWAPLGDLGVCEQATSVAWSFSNSTEGVSGN
jgi:hypothetical protein